jgi:hypothetical protein
MGTRLKGVPQVIRNAKRFSAKHGHNCAVGLKKAGLHLQRCSQQIVPVDQGALKNSAFTRSFGVGFNCDVVVGYTEDYAAYVHENLDAAHGKAFNIKHADKIARGRKTRRLYKKKFGNKPPGQKPYFRARGPGQMAKYLEFPARLERKTMLSIVAKEARIKRTGAV